MDNQICHHLITIDIQLISISIILVKPQHKAIGRAWNKSSHTKTCFRNVYYLLMLLMTKEEESFHNHQGPLNNNYIQNQWNLISKTNITDILQKNIIETTVRPSLWIQGGMILCIARMNKRRLQWYKSHKQIIIIHRTVKIQDKNCHKEWKIQIWIKI